MFLQLSKIQSEEYLALSAEIYSYPPPFSDDTGDIDYRNQINGEKIVGGNLLTQVCDFCLKFRDHEKCIKTYKNFFDPYLQAGSYDNLLFAKKVRAYYMHIAHDKSSKVYERNHDNYHFLEACKDFKKLKEQVISVNGHCPYRKYLDQL